MKAREYLITILTAGTLACEGDPFARQGVYNAPCTETSQCLDTLECLSGYCRPFCPTPKECLAVEVQDDVCVCVLAESARGAR